MDTSTVTVKGQIVVPARIRKKLGLKKGSKVAIIEDENGFSVKPLDKRYFDRFAGMLPQKGRATRALLKDRHKERRNEDTRAR